MHNYFSNSWFAIQVRPRLEKQTANFLNQKGYPVFLPLMKEKSNSSDRAKERQVPIFSGYLFCELDAKVRLPVLTTPGVVRIAGTGKSPEPVDPQELLALERLAESGLPFEPYPFTPGQMVVIEDGPLRGLMGILQEVTKGRSLIISLSILQRSVSVTLAEDRVRPVSESELNAGFIDVDTRAKQWV